jgi:hypothetical protein
MPAHRQVAVGVLVCVCLPRRCAVITEADTCRKYVLPRLYEAGWTDDQISEQKYFTDGRIVPVGRGHVRKPGRRADYLLRYRPDSPIAVLEAKAAYRKPGDGLQQAIEYAGILGLKFAYATNGHGIEEYDFITGRQTSRDDFPSPGELWQRWCHDQEIASAADAEGLLFPFNRELRNPDGTVKRPRYYQEIAIKRAVQAITQGKKRILITMATGTGKTFVAMQIVWKLWKTRRKRRILYLADRNILVDQAVAARIKEDLLKNFNLHTVVRLPNGVFAPYTSVPTSLLFFQRDGPTKEIWYYELPLPEGRKNYTKTKPLRDAEFDECCALWDERPVTEHSWRVPVAQVIETDYNLDIKNLSSQEALVHCPPEELAEAIFTKEQRIAEIMTRIKQTLNRAEM